MSAAGARCEQCAIRHQAICGALNDAELRRLSEIARQRQVKAGEPIVSAEDEATSFANIVSGVVKLSKILPDGRQQIVGLQFAPDFLGRPYRKRAPFFAEAASDVQLCVFPRAGFERLLGEIHDLETRLFQDTLDELDAARDWMLLLGRKTAAEKVATFLSLVARRNAMIGCAHTPALAKQTIILPLTRAEIADYLGLTIETVSRQLGRLKSQGVLAVGSNRAITVLDPEALEAAAEG